MRARSAWAGGLAASLAIAAGAALAATQPAGLLGALQADDPLRALLQARYDESSSRLLAFERELLTAQALTFLVGALGACTAALQAVKESWTARARRATVLIGFLISLTTVYRASFLAEEPGSIRERIRALQDARKGLEVALMQLPVDPVQRRVYVIEAFKSFDRGLTRASTHGTAPAAAPVVGASFSLVASAEAAVAGPAPVPADDPETLYRAGRAQAATVEQAKALSLEDALAKLMAELPREPGQADERQAEAAALRRYVEDNKCEVATRVGYDPVTRAFDYQTVLAFPRWLLQPGLVREHVSLYSQPVVEAPPAPPSADEVRGERTILLSALPVTAEVRVQGRRPKDGSFTFAFSAHREASAGAVLTLDRIEVHADGSAGRTEWRFDVSVADRVVLSLGPSAYSDRHSPARPPGGALDVSLDGLMGKPVEIRVVGSRVKAL